MSDTEFDNCIVFCQGCHHKVKRSKAKFVIWGGVHCFFCDLCLSAIHKATQSGNPIMTRDELMAKYKQELLQQPAMDGELPLYCKNKRCTERGPKCAKCAYTAMGNYTES